MRRFELLEPRSLDEAWQLLAGREDAKFIAGGTALLILIKQGILVPPVLVNLKKITGASEITYDPNKGLRVGALASIFDVETSAEVKSHYPVLAHACHVVANIRIRNLATIGGNLAHADYQSDPPTALVALGARVELIGSEGTRELPLEEFLLGSYETALRPGELLSALTLPVCPAGFQANYIKFTTRSSEDRPCAGVVAMVRGENDLCTEARLVIGAVSAAPVRVRKAEDLARGQKLTSDLIQEMAAEAARVVDPIEDLRGPADYKRHIVGVLARRALEAAAGRGERA
jgi:aerobic carbon-monoxide dehydrogenase medium subunit